MIDGCFKCGPQQRSGLARQEEILALLNAGHRRGASVPRLERQGDRFVLVNREVYGPKAFGLIGNLPSTLESRCVFISVQRRTEEQRQRARRFLHSRFKLQAVPIHAAMVSLGQEHVEAVRAVYQSLGDVEWLGERDVDLWMRCSRSCESSRPSGKKSCASVL